MKQLRFLLIEQSRKENHKDLVRTIEKMGHKAYWFRLDAVTVTTGKKGSVAFFGGIPISEFDIVLPRTVSSNLRLGRFVIRLCHKKQFVLDKIICERDTFGKLSQANTLLNAGIRHPETIFANNLSELKKHLKQIGFPCIAKPIVGSQGRGVRLIKNYSEALRVFPTLGEDYVFQRYLPISFDYRVFVVGGTVLGAMKRYVVANDVRSNASLGARTEAVIISKSVEKLALKAASTFGYDVAGVDIVEAENSLFVLEVNRTPQWQGLKKTLSIKPEEAIIEMCIKRHASLQ